MSHFNLAVFSRTDSRAEPDQLLEPYNEAVDSSSPYAEFVKDEGSKFDKIARATGCWRNLNAKWDWWADAGAGCSDCIPAKPAIVYRWINGQRILSILKTHMTLPLCVTAIFQITWKATEWRSAAGRSSWKER